MNAARISHIVALSSLLLLLALVFSWIIWFLSPPHMARPILLLLAALPLAIPLRGILHERSRSHLLAAILSLLYILHGGVELWAGESSVWLPLLETLLAVTLFFSATLHIRFAAGMAGNSQ